MIILLFYSSSRRDSYGSFFFGGNLLHGFLQSSLKGLLRWSHEGHNAIDNDNDAGDGFVFSLLVDRYVQFKNDHKGGRGVIFRFSVSASMRDTGSSNKRPFSHTLHSTVDFDLHSL